MNRKQVAILKQFLDRPAWQIAELTEGMSLSQSMVRHELRGVNDYLLRLGLPEIETARGELTALWQDHPRLRGEQRLPRTKLLCCQGSPPLARGTVNALHTKK